MFQAHQEIQTLQSETQRLKSLKICLNQQRNAYIREISQRSGEEAADGDDDEDEVSHDSGCF